VIRVVCTKEGLEQQIQEYKPGWRKWSDIKPVFLDLQHHKCGFCESFIGGQYSPEEDRRDLYEQDVEHFRPKAQVKQWEAPEAWGQGPELQVGRPHGYPWLSHDPENYLASCKTCNSGRKRTYFPVRTPLQDYDDEPSVTSLKGEQPYLLFPLGEVEDIDPQEYIEFLGDQPVPHHQWEEGTQEYWRAAVTIEVLGLRRADLSLPRKRAIVRLARERCTLPLASPNGWRPILEAQGDAHHPFSSCVRSYLRLCEENPELAQELAVRFARELGLPEEEIELLEGIWPD